MMTAREWIAGDESAREMLMRALTARPALHLPPLHRLPLRPGNVVEIVGPSPSAKSEILIQAAISCILPKEWNGLHFGGLERLVVYIDLDCRFDVHRLAHSLKNRIVDCQSYYYEELFRACMQRFMYVRCYNSTEFLAALKTLHYQLQKEMDSQKVLAYLLMIDSINAFYWVDRASRPLSFDGSRRKHFSLQVVTEAVVLEIRELLNVYPMLVLATKGSAIQTGGSTGNIKRKWSFEDSESGTEKLFLKDVMPSAWQLFVTHRVIVWMTGLLDSTLFWYIKLKWLLYVNGEGIDFLDENVADGSGGSFTMYASEWVLPSLKVSDKFTVKEAGIFIIT